MPTGMLIHVTPPGLWTRYKFSMVTSYGILSGSLLPELFGEPDENSFRTTNIAESIHVFILDYFADELRAALAEPDERIVDVLHGEHDA